jgi:hypothetical protein
MQWKKAAFRMPAWPSQINRQTYSLQHGESAQLKEAVFIFRGPSNPAQPTLKMRSFIAIVPALLSLASALPTESVLETNTTGLPLNTTSLEHPSFIPDGHQIVNVGGYSVMDPFGNITNPVDIEAIVEGVKAELIPNGIVKRNNGDCQAVRKMITFCHLKHCGSFLLSKVLRKLC